MCNLLARLRVAGAAALILWSGAAVGAHRITVTRGGTESTYLLDGDKLRLEQKGSPRVIIFNGKSKEYFELDTEKKTWAVANLHDVQAEGQAAGARMEAGDATLSPEQRERARKERRERLAHWTRLLKDTKFVPTGNQGLVAEHVCDGYQERVGDRVVADGCYIPWSRKAIQKEDLAPVTRFAEFLNTAFARVPSAAGIDLRDGPLGRLGRAPGFPALRYDIAPDGKSGVQLKLLELVSTLTVPPEAFLPPAGYAKLDRPAAVVDPIIRQTREQAPVLP